MAENAEKTLAFICESTGCCNKWLIGINPEGQLETYDGGHDTAQGVAKALELRKQIRCINPKPGTRFVMVTVEEVPEFTGEDTIDQEAVDACNQMSGQKR